MFSVGRSVLPQMYGSDYASMDLCTCAEREDEPSHFARKSGVMGSSLGGASVTGVLGSNLPAPVMFAGG